MVRLVSYLLLLVVGLRGNAQLWNKTYIEDRPVMLFSSIIKASSEYKIIGLVADKSSPYRARALAGTIDLNGQMTAYKAQRDSSEMDFGVFVNSLIQTTKGDFAFSGYVNDSISRLLFARFDTSLDSFNIYTYSTPNTYAFYGNALVQTDDNSFFITGVRTISSSNNANVVLVKIDSNGNRLWEKYYDQLKMDFAKSIIVLQNGNLMLGGVRSDQHSGNTNFNTWLMEVDTGGVVVREWFNPNDSTYVA